jgi:hypothetical protein
MNEQFFLNGLLSYPHALGLALAFIAIETYWNRDEPFTIEELLP